MICPVEIGRKISALWAGRMRDHAEHGSLSEGRDGAGDEGTGRDVQAMAKNITWSPELSRLDLKYIAIASKRPIC